MARSSQPPLWAAAIVWAGYRWTQALQRPSLRQTEARLSAPAAMRQAQTFNAPAHAL